MTLKAYADNETGSLYLMQFATEDEAAAYEPPADRSHLPTPPSLDHRWTGGAWVAPDLQAMEAEAKAAREAEADAAFIARAARLGYVKQSEVNGLIDARIRPNKA